MRLSLATAILVAASLPRCTCAAPCVDAADCAGGAVCTDGVCVDGAPTPAPVIFAVDGDGGERAPDVTGVPLDVVGERKPARHRLRSSLIVSGEDLDTITDASLEGAASSTALTIDSVSQAGDTMTLTLPPLVPGLFTLVLAGSAGEARAQVFVLQGEPGPSSIIEPRAASSTECSGGGVRFFVGLDVDGDGVLAAAEEDVARSARVVCNGIDSSILDATSLLVSVPTDFATIALALDAFRDVRLAAKSTLTIFIDVGEHIEPAAVRVEHADGDRIRIEGAGAAETTLRFVGTDGIVVDGGRLGAIANLTLAGDDTPETAGVLARNGGRIVVEAGVLVRDFDDGVSATRGAVVIADGTFAVSNASFGYTASFGGHIDAIGGESNGSRTGFLVDRGGTLEASSCRSTQNSENGALAARGSLASLNDCTLSGQTIGMKAVDLGMIVATGATATGPIRVQVTRNAVIRSEACVGGGVEQFDSAQCVTP